MTSFLHRIIFYKYIFLYIYFSFILWLLIIIDHHWSVCVFPSLPSPDQRDPDHFCPVLSRWPCFPVTDRTHSLWHQLEETDHSKQNHKTNTIQSWDWGGAKHPAPCDQFPSANFSPQRNEKKNLQHISLSARSVLLLNNQRLRNLLEPHVEIASCLNWIDECIVTAIVFVCLFLFFYLLFYWAIKCMSKGKVK